jgi:antitoxin HicB
MRFAFPCNIVRDEEEAEDTGREAYVVTFPDVCGASTGGWSWEEAIEMAEDCLSVALSVYVDRKEPIPAPSALVDDQVLIPVPLRVAAKLALYTTMRERGLSNGHLASKLGMSEPAVIKLVNPIYRSPINHVEKALKAVGCSLLVEDSSKIALQPAEAAGSIVRA